MTYLKQIDGIRAIAVLAVIFFHLNSDIVSGGFLGVDVFFVISGYVISMLILTKLEKQSFSLREFYLSRIFRLIPALIVLMTISSIVAWKVLPPIPLKDFGQSLVASILFLANFLFFIEGGYFETPGLEKPLFHMWSLSIEWQFYLLFPFLIILFSKFKKGKVLNIAIFIIFISSLLGFYFATKNESFYFGWYRVWEFLLGYFAFKIRFFNLKLIYSNLISHTCLIGLLYLFLFAHEGNKFSLVASVVFTTLILYLSRSTDSALPLLKARALTGIGLLSFSLYIWHYPIFAFYRIYTGDLSISFSDYWLLLVVFFIAYLSWYFIEQPLRGKSTLYEVPKQKALLVIFLFLFTLFGYGIFLHSTDGYKARYDLSPLQRSYLDTAKGNFSNSCHANSLATSVVNPCIWGGSDARFAVLGDSHASELAYALGKQVKQRNEGVVQLSRTACRPDYMKIQEPCGQWLTNAVHYLRLRKDLETVLVSFNINADLFGLHYNYYPSFPNSFSDSYRFSLMERYKKMLLKLSETKHVFVILQAPELPRYIQYSIYSLRENEMHLKGVNKSWWNKRGAFFSEQVKEMQRYNNISIVDPAEYFCDEKYCYAGRNGVSYYYDHNHMSIKGAEIVTSHMLKNII